MRTVTVAALLALSVLSVPRSAAAPNILLITLDTTRADRMGFMGSARGLTPALDALSRRSTVFTRAFAQAPITTVSHATILTGTYPPFHQVDDFGAPLSASVPYLPDVLRQRGYRTAAFVGSLGTRSSQRHGARLRSWVRGLRAGFALRRPGENRYRTLERRGADVVSRARTWLSRCRRRSFFGSTCSIGKIRRWPDISNGGMPASRNGKLRRRIGPSASS